MERISAVLCICCGVTGAGLQYVQDGGMTDVVLKTGAIGIGAGIFVFLFHLTTDEKYKLCYNTKCDLRLEIFRNIAII